MDGSEGEVLAVLREIRELQRQHFERYLEFTTQVKEQQQRSSARAEKDSAAALEEQRRTGRALRFQAAVTPVLAVLLAACVGALGWLAFSR